MLALSPPLFLGPREERAPSELCTQGLSFLLLSFFFFLGAATHTISDKKRREERERKESVGEEPRERNAWGSARRAPCEGYLEEVTRGSWWS